MEIIVKLIFFTVGVVFAVGYYALMDLYLGYLEDKQKRRQNIEK